VTSVPQRRQLLEPEPLPLPDPLPLPELSLLPPVVRDSDTLLLLLLCDELVPDDMLPEEEGVPSVELALLPDELPPLPDDPPPDVPPPPEVPPPDGAGVSKRDGETLAPNRPEAGDGRQSRLWPRTDQRPRSRQCPLAKPLRNPAYPTTTPPRSLGGVVREPWGRSRLQPTG